MGTNVSKQSTASIFRVEDEGNSFLQKMCIHLENSPLELSQKTVILICVVLLLVILLKSGSFI
jgi:hypothetical protein